jgi:hypothetical protein
MALAACLAESPFAIASAQPAPASGLIFGVDTAADRPTLDPVQYFWAGHNYCWYYNGWNGPGWYWCGYPWRRGFGWGGPYGWHGWRGGGHYYGHGGHYHGHEDGWHGHDGDGHGEGHGYGHGHEHGHH